MMKRLFRFALAALSAVACTVHAQSYPSKPVRIIVPYTPGSTVDVMSRIIAPKLTSALGQQVIVENRAGAGGAIGMAATAKAPKDGHSMMLAASGFAIIPNLKSDLSWHPIKDFAPIAQVATAPLVIVVTPDVPAKTLSELIALAKSRPGKLRYGHAGVGSSQHMAGELFCLAAGIDLVDIPYKGGKESLTDMLGGRLEMSYQGVPPVLPQVRAGSVRPIAVTSQKRSSALPNVPTIGEAGLPAATAEVWYGLLAPGGTPAAIIARLNAEVIKLMSSQDVREGFKKNGAEVVTGSSEAFAQMITKDLATWAKVVKQRGIKRE